MRVRLSGSTITAHGDNLGTPFVEFPGNEPLGFSTDWTVSGSSPLRKLVDPHGHEYSVELPTQTAPAPSGGGVNVDNGVDAPAAVTTLVAPGAVIADGSASLLNAFIVGPFTVSGDDAALQADWVVLYPWPAGAVVIAVMVNVTADFVGSGTLHVRTHSGNTVYEDPNPAGDGWKEILSNGLTPVAIGVSTSHPSLSATIDTLGSAGSADIYAIIATAS